MAEVFRIIDQFHILERGTVYTIKPGKESMLRLEDILFDLYGNQFRVKGVEMITRCFGDKPTTSIAESPMGVLLESINGAEMQGRILAKDLSISASFSAAIPFLPAKSMRITRKNIAWQGRTIPVLFSVTKILNRANSLFTDNQSLV